MRYGLRETDLACIIDAVRQREEIEEAVLFGSRAKGNYENGSDVDLVIKGNRITFSTVLRLSGWLNEESPMPYFFDVVQYETISNPKLTEHIDKVGITLFTRFPEKEASSTPPPAIEQL